jgi:hypothetical protein
MSPVMEEGPLLVIPGIEIWCYSCAEVVFEWCHIGLTVIYSVVGWRHSDLQWSYSDVTVVLQWCHKRFLTLYLSL